MDDGLIGRALHRIEDFRFLTGRGRYVEDIDLPGQLHAVVLRSPHGHAVIDRIEKLCAEVGLSGEEIIIRSTGCPNGCARPYMAEIAFVGKAPGRYQLWLGGNTAGTRLNRIWKDVVKDPDFEAELRPLLSRYAGERQPGERFGDWAARVLWNEAPQQATPVGVPAA